MTDASTEKVEPHSNFTTDARCGGVAIVILLFALVSFSKLLLLFPAVPINEVQWDLEEVPEAQDKIRGNLLRVNIILRVIIIIIICSHCTMDRSINDSAVSVVKNQSEA